MWKQITTVADCGCELLQLCSKNVRIKCESKSQQEAAAPAEVESCVQRTSGLNVKANHNYPQRLNSLPVLCSKNVRIKCESKSQPIHDWAAQAVRCVQRTSGLNVKANHNDYVDDRKFNQLCSKNVRIKCESKSQRSVHWHWWLSVVFKERPD